MAIRGEITIECDTKECQAEEVFDAQTVLEASSIDHLIWDREWKVRGDKFICPHCVEEGK